MTPSLSVRRLALFDIDGTLIHTARAGVRGMNAAFRDLHGHEDALAGMTFAGRTDRAIVFEAFAQLGIDRSQAALDRLRDAYLAHLSAELGHPVEGARVLPGVTGILDALEAHSDIGVGLLTGNFERGAAIKLGHFDLWRRFGFGAFGDAHEDRRALVPIAIEAAEAAIGQRIAAPDVVVIGDTPLDIDCARAHGAVSVAVATGPYSAEQLRDAGADVVLDTLEDVPALLRVLRS
jgi:phosphoglycolate phosphatase-like HAD superfamily hydrolase